jgi:hypothetical protein
MRVEVGYNAVPRRRRRGRLYDTSDGTDGYHPYCLLKSDDQLALKARV